jgi:hypothetical protein
VGVSQAPGERSSCPGTRDSDDPYQPSVNRPDSYWLMRVTFFRSVAFSSLSLNESRGLYQAKLEK